METNFLKYILEDEEHFGAQKYYRALFFSSEKQSEGINSRSTLNNPEDDYPDQGDETGYYSPEIYRDEEEYLGSPQNQSEDDALILFTTSFLEEEIIWKCIDEINPDYLRSKEWELRWLAAKVRFRA
jgi:hypothetical protein